MPVLGGVTRWNLSEQQPGALASQRLVIVMRLRHVAGDSLHISIGWTDELLLFKKICTD